MIGYLRGRVIERLGTDEVLVDVGGVGYRVTATPVTLAAVGEPGREIELHTHQHVRDDAVVLYGFATRDERVCFEAVIGAHGVGPALALAILSVHPPAALRRVLFDDDVAALTEVPGVGKKTAAKLLLELKGRLDVPDVDLTAGGAVASSLDEGGRADVRAALAELGYRSDEVRAAVADLPDDVDAGELLRLALRRLVRAG